MSGSSAGRIRVAVIFGGRSGEHEISLASAANVMAALRPDRYEVVPVGIDRSGRWLASPEAHRLLSQGEPLPGADVSQAIATLNGPAGLVDVVFPVLHGTRGEDGAIQGFLEMAGVAYVGCGVLASALAMDKVLSKQVLREQGFRVAADLWFHSEGWSEDARGRVEEICGYPCFVKPANLGSSVGISKVNRPEDLAAAVQLAGQYDRKIVVERAVRNPREIECAVLGNDQPEASVPGEVRPNREFYDYAAKYLDNSSELLIPAPLAPELTTQIRETAIRAFQALDCSGMARVDFLLYGEDGGLYVNELNTIPGFTAISMYPKLWEATGLSYSALIDRLIDLAIERHEQRERLSTLR